MWVVLFIELSIISNTINHLFVAIFSYLDHFTIGEWRALKGIIIGIVISILVLGCGNFALLNYAILIFERSGAHINPYISSIMLFVAQIIGCICSTGLADKLGRKFLIIVSLVGSAIGLITLAVYLHLMEHGVDTQLFTWIPVASLSFAIFIGSAGIVPLGAICTIEQLPSKVRTQSSWK